MDPKLVSTAKPRSSAGKAAALKLTRASGIRNQDPEGWKRSNLGGNIRWEAAHQFPTDNHDSEHHSLKSQFLSPQTLSVHLSASRDSNRQFDWPCFITFVSMELTSPLIGSNLSDDDFAISPSTRAPPQSPGPAATTKVSRGLDFGEESH